VVSVYSTRELANDWIDHDLRESFGNFDNFEDMGRDERLELAERHNVFYTVHPAQLDPTD
jgi:hypothetical protein